MSEDQEWLEKADDARKEGFASFEELKHLMDQVNDMADNTTLVNRSGEGASV